jgi:hypothetical protein
MGYSNNNNNHNNTGVITGHSEAKQPDKRFAVAASSSKHCTEQRNRKVLSASIFYPVLPHFQKSIAFWKVPRFRPFVLLAGNVHTPSRL